MTNKQARLKHGHQQGSRRYRKRAAARHFTPGMPERKTEARRHARQMQHTLPLATNDAVRDALDRRRRLHRARLQRRQSTRTPDDDTTTAARLVPANETANGQVSSTRLSDAMRRGQHLLVGWSVRFRHGQGESRGDEQR